MSKYKININKPNPSDKQINESKDFNKFLQTYSELHQPHKIVRTIHKNKKLIRLLILIIILLFTFLFSQNYFETENQVIEQDKIEHDSINENSER